MTTKTLSLCVTGRTEIHTQAKWQPHYLGKQASHTGMQAASPARHIHTQTQAHMRPRPPCPTSLLFTLSLTGNPHMQMLTHNRHKPIITTWSISVCETFKLKFWDDSLVKSCLSLKKGDTRAAHFNSPIMAVIALCFASPM